MMTTTTDLGEFQFVSKKLSCFQISQSGIVAPNSYYTKSNPEALSPTLLESLLQTEMWRSYIIRKRMYIKNKTTKKKQDNQNQEPRCKTGTETLIIKE